MNQVQGMSITQLKSTLDEMRKVYKFDDDKTYFANMHDKISDSQRHVEIISRDEATGVNIVMSKDVLENREADYTGIRKYVAKTDAEKADTVKY